MLICRKCKQEIPEASKYCNLCGAIQEPKKNRHRRRANGSGSVYKLSENRRNPWGASVYKNGKRVFLGTFAKASEAEAAIVRFKDDELSDKINYTVEHVHTEWQKVHYRDLTKSGEDGYNSAWNYLQCFRNKKMRELKSAEVQSLIDEIAQQKSRSVCEKVRQLYSQLCKWAMKEDIINKNYAQFIKLPKSHKTEKEIFKQAEIDLIKDHDNDQTAQIILTMIYSGLRINELFDIEICNVHLDEGYMIGGLKTEAGRDRIIPINRHIRPYIEGWYSGSDNVGKYKYLVRNESGQRINDANWRKRKFYPFLRSLGILGEEEGTTGHPPRLTPHSCRHTYASLAVQANIPEELLKTLIGHADYSTTINLYNHDDISDLKKAAELI